MAEETEAGRLIGWLLLGNSGRTEWDTKAQVCMTQAEALSTSLPRALQWFCQVAPCFCPIGSTVAEREACYPARCNEATWLVQYVDVNTDLCRAAS